MISQELADGRACLMHLDATLDGQMNTLQVVFTSKCIIREEVEKAKKGA